MPLSAETSTLTLQNGAITVVSTQIVFGREIETVFVVRMLALDGEPVAIVDQADINGEALPADVVAQLEREISAGFSAELRRQTNYTAIESIVIANGQMTLTYR